VVRSRFVWVDGWRTFEVPPDVVVVT